MLPLDSTVRRRSLKKLQPHLIIKTKTSFIFNHLMVSQGGCGRTVLSNKTKTATVWTVGRTFVGTFKHQNTILEFLLHSKAEGL